MSRFWGNAARRISPTDAIQTPLHADIGYGAFRIGEPLRCKWFNLEPTAGTFDLADLGAMIETVKSAGLHPLFTFGGPPVHARIGEDVNNPPDPDRYRTLIERVAEEFKGGGISYELWNEIDYPMFYNGDQAQGITMMRGAASIIKSVDPSSRVVSASFLYIGAAEMQAYLEAGAFSDCDAISFHAYCYPAQPEVLLLGVQPFIKLARSYKLPLLNTEWSWGPFKVGGTGETYSWPTLMTDDQASAYKVRSNIMLANLGVKENYFFGIDQHISGNAEFSTMEYIDSNDLSVKLGPAIADQYQISLLAGGKLYGLTRFAEGWVQPFTSSAEATGKIIWCSDGKTATIDASSFSSCTDMYGNALTPTASFGVDYRPTYFFD